MPLDFASLKAEYANLIKSVAVDTDPHKLAAINALVTKIIANQDTYKQVTKLVAGMPWQAIAAIHAMEKSCDFSCHLHNGDPLNARTTHVPSGRPPTGSPPFDWVASAVDALTMPKHFLDTVKDWPIERVAFELEKYNGFGYRKRVPPLNSPYVWAWTNHHTKGRFIADHVFDANAKSEQPGAMAVLKALADRGLGIDNAGGTSGGGDVAVNGGIDGMLTAKTRQLETGLFLPAGSFELLPTGTSLPSDDPDFANLIDPGLRCKKLGEVGQNWEIEVQSQPVRRGFARGGIFSPIVLDGSVDIDAFAQMCLTAARQFQTSAHHLVAVADTETGIRNVAADQGDGIGPFLITESDWNGFLNGTGLTAQQRFDPLAQPFIAAKAAAADTGVLQPTLPNRLPTSAELFLAHLVGAAHAISVLANPAAVFQTAVSNAIGVPAFATLSAVRPWLLGSQLDVTSAMEKIARRMDFGYDRADGLFKRIEPDTPLASAAGFAGKLCTMASTEWTFFGKNTRNLDGQLTHAGHREAEPGFFERVGAYWQKLGLNFDGRTDKPWSAAFISFVVKGCGAAGKFHESPQHSVYISQAIRDFNDKADVAYWCHRLTDLKPKAGDIICWARESGVDYDHQKNGDYAGHTDIVIEVRGNEFDVIGGNVGNSVTKRTFALDANGFVKGGTFQGELLFAIMENRLP